MKKLMLLLFCFCMLGVQKQSAQEIKVLSYNIHYGYGMDSKRDLSRIADIINESKADIVGLQEIADSLMAAQLAKLTNMKVVFGPSKESVSEYGDAVLTGYPFKYIGNVSIPSASSSRYQAMCVDIDLSNRYGEDCTVRLINTHFDWKETIGSEEARKAAVEVIERAFLNEPQYYPSLLTGDLNATPGSETIRLLLANDWFHENDNAPPLMTEPSTNPDKQIDYVMVRPTQSWEIVDVSVIDEPMASDHLPVLMTVKLICH